LADCEQAEEEEEEEEKEEGEEDGDDRNDGDGTYVLVQFALEGKRRKEVDRINVDSDKLTSL
jgi:hypothetical protein